MMGPGGMPSFGHAAWFGIGAYAAGLLAQRRAAPRWRRPARGAGGRRARRRCCSARFVVRLSGVYLAMLTLAFAQIVWAVAFQSVEWTGGDNGILGVWPPGWARGPAAFYWLALALCLGGALLLRRVLYAPFGYALRAARDSALRAEAIGVSVRGGCGSPPSPWPARRPGWRAGCTPTPRAACSRPTSASRNRWTRC